MNNPPAGSSRLLPASGVAFVVLFAVAATLYASGAGSSQADITAYYADPAAYGHQIAGFMVLTIGCLALMTFVVVSTRDLARGGISHDLSLISGATACAFLLLANALWAATAFTVIIQRTYFVLATTHLIVEDAAFVCLVTSMAAGLPWVLVTSFGNVAPEWLRAIGILSAAGQVLAYLYLPLAAFLLWVVAGSLLLTVRSINADA